jgi:hypothetical protein
MVSGGVNAHFANSTFNSGPVQSKVATPVIGKDQMTPPGLEQYLAARARQRTSNAPATSQAAAEAWVRQFSAPNDGSNIDPATGMPRFTTTVTLRQTPDSLEARQDSHFGAQLLKNIQFVLTFLPAEKALIRSVPAEKTPGRK